MGKKKAKKSSKNLSKLKKMIKEFNEIKTSDEIIKSLEEELNDDPLLKEVIIYEDKDSELLKDISKDEVKKIEK